MADESTESIGGVRITIRGDFSQLEADFQAAVADARANGANVAAAISQAFDTLAAHGEFASYQIKQVGESLAGLAAPAQAAAASMATVNEELDATGQNVAYAGENFGKLEQASSQTFRSMVTDLRFWSRSVVILMAPEMFANIVSGIVAFFQKQNDAIHESIVNWGDFNAALRISDDELAVTNDKLANQIALLEGDSPNKFKLGLDEATVSAEKLAKALTDDLGAAIKKLGEDNTKWWDAILGAPGLKDLTDYLKILQEQMANTKTSAGQMNVLNEEIRATARALEHLQAAGRPIALAVPIQAATAALEHFREELRHVQEEQEHGNLQKELGAAQDSELKEKQTGTPFGNAITQQMAKDADEAYQHLIADLAHYNEMLEAGMVLERKSGETMADWAHRNQEALDAVKAGPPEITKDFDEMFKSIQEGAKEFNRTTGGILDPLKQAQDAAKGVQDLDRAFKELKVSDAAPALEEVSKDLALIKAQFDAGKVSAEQWGEAQLAAMERLHPEIRRVAEEVQSAFDSIDDAISRSIVHWKGLESAILGILQDLAQKGLSILLKSLLAPAESALQQLVSGVLGGLGGAAGAAAGGSGFNPLLIAGEFAGFAEGTDYVPKTGLAMIHEGERIIPKAENLSMKYYRSDSHNASVGTHFDFRGSRFTGVTDDLVGNVMDRAVKKGRRAGAKW